MSKTGIASAVQPFRHLFDGPTLKEALSHAALVDRHLADGRPWMLGGEAPTFADITLCTAIAFSRFPVNATPLCDRPFPNRPGESF